MGQFDEQSHAKASDDRLAGCSRERRALVGSMAAFGAGLADSVIVTTNVMALSSDGLIQIQNPQKCLAGEVRSLRRMLRPLQRRLQERFVDLSGTACTF